MWKSALVKGELTLTQEGFLQATAYLPGTQN
ncbi:hypothetical protein L668_23000 [Escherichia coli 95NR1]|nr:hypothetical protein FORC28_2652 [Escherichia coli]ERA61333.1 hypothetical protein L668_23000 [Escherichia coli 95NR1]ETJ55907.1 hypothetical protein Q456_0226525 [Escherichia coli ATCC BAA-2193]